MANYTRQQIIAIITAAANRYGVPPEALIATAMVESGLNTSAEGDKGTSFGLFQEHEGGELVSVADAENPVYAANKAAQTIAAAKQQNPSASWGQAAAAAQRPANETAYAQDVDGTISQLGGNPGTVGGSGEGVNSGGPDLNALANPPKPNPTLASVQAQTKGEPAGAGALVNVPTTPYTGAGAYQGFDLSAIPADLQPQVKNAINEYLTIPGLTKAVLSDIEDNYGAQSWAADDPQIRTLLVAGSVLDWEKDPNMVQSLLQRTTLYHNRSASNVSWMQMQADDPKDAAEIQSGVEGQINTTAASMGVQLTPAQLKRISDIVTPQSISPDSNTFDTTLYNQQNVASLIAKEFNATTFLASQGNAPTPSLTSNAAGVTEYTAATGAAGGDAASLYNQFQALAKNYYLPMTNQQIAAQVQKYLQTDTGQPGFVASAVQGFETYVKQASALLYPALAGIIGTSNAEGATAQTPYSALSYYRTMIANLTGYQGDPDTINLASPQNSWILSGKPPPGSATGAGQPTTPLGTLPTLDTVQSYYMQQPAYQSTDAAKASAWQIGAGILKAFGFTD